MEYTMSPAQIESQKPEPQRVQYAGFWRRFVAAIIDGLIINLATWAIGIAFGIGNMSFFSMFGRHRQLTNAEAEAAAMTIVGGFLLAALVIGVLTFLYYAFMESSKAQATIGKMALGIKVTDLEGNRISFGRALGRNLSKIVSAIILYIGYIMAGFTEKKQALHDMIAGTLVLSKAPVVSPEVAQQAFPQPAQA